MVDSKRDYEIQQAFSYTKETAYGTPVADIDIDKAMMFLGPDIVDRVPTFDDDKNEYGKMHEFRTRQYLMSWDAKRKVQVKGTVEFLAWLAAFGLGAVTTSQPNLAMNPTVILASIHALVIIGI